MPASTSPLRVRLALASSLLLLGVWALSAQPEPTPQPPERILITPAELQKLHDQIEQFKQQASLRKPMPPSTCRVNARIEKRGETSLAAIRLTFSFRTTVPKTTVSLGAKRAFLVDAKLDCRGGFLGSALDVLSGKRKIPILDATDDGFTVLIDQPGDHTLVLDLEAPVVGRGTKTEVGFELGLPRAAITTLSLETPGEIRRVNLTTRTPDNSQPAKPPELRRLSGVEVKLLAPQPEGGYPLGPVDSLEVSWDPPTSSAQPNEAVLSAEWEVVCKLAERTIETEAKLRPHGSTRIWRVVLPKGSDLRATRAVREPGMDIGPLLLPVVTRPADPNKLVWTIEIPTGSSTSDWIFSATLRQDRVKEVDPSKPVSIAVGPFAVLDVARQSGTVRVSATGSVRFEFTNGPEMQRLPTAEAGDNGITDLLFRLTTGPTNGNIPAPLLQFKAFPVAGAVRVKPSYRLTLTPVAWQVEADLLITPVRTEIDSLTVEVPVNWRSLVAEPAELVEGVLQDESTEGTRRTATIRLASGQRRPFELKLRASSPLGETPGEAVVLLPRFPRASQRGNPLEVRDRDATVTASVGPGLEVRGAGREWDGINATAWGTALSREPGESVKPGSAVSGSFEFGVARVDLAWEPRRTEMIAEMRADAVVERRQIRIMQTIQLRGAEGLPATIRLRGPVALTGMKAMPPLREIAPGEWSAEAVPAAGVLKIEYAVPSESHGAPPGESWSAPVPLFWPTDATRTETTASVAIGTGGIQIQQMETAGWREIPATEGDKRAAVPAAQFACTGTEVPISLILRKAEGPGVTLLGVSRAYIRVRVSAFGPTEYDARFRIQHWQTDSIAIHVPGALVGESPEVLLDGMPVAAGFRPDSDDSSGVIFHVPLPASRIDSINLEVKYQLSGSATLRPPAISGATFDGPIRWQVMLPAGVVPLVRDGALSEQDWSWRTGVLTPTASRSAADLEHWFRTGVDPPNPGAGASGELVLRQSQPMDIRIVAVPRFGLLALCSAAAFACGFAVTQLRGSIGGPLVALLGGIAAAAAVLFPQPCSQIVGAIQPGIVVLLLLLAALALRKWAARRRVTHLPGFTRRRIEQPSVPSTANTVGSAIKPPMPSGSTGSDRPQPVEPHPATGS